MSYRNLMDYSVDCEFDSITIDIEEDIKIIRMSFFMNNHFVDDVHIKYGEVKNEKESGRI